MIVAQFGGLVSHAAHSTVTSASWRSSNPRVSADGRYVAFFSEAFNLVPGQGFTPNSSDIFLYDRATGTNRLLSGSGGSATQPGNGASNSVSVSPDGGYVAFYSLASDLVPGKHDLNQGHDVFLHDLAAGTTSLITAAGPGMRPDTGNLASGEPSVSGDGLRAVFSSAAANLVPALADTNWGDEIFLRDRASGTTVLVSHAAGSPDTAADASSWDAVLSRDGEWVVFASGARNLVAGQVDSNLDPYSNNGSGIFLYERATGTVTLVSHAAGSAATAGDGISFAPSISVDGRFVAYASRATDLVAGQSDANGGPDVFLYDRTTGLNVLVSRASGASATAGNGLSQSPSLSADGAYVAFASEADDLVPGQGAPHAGSNVFVFERSSGTTLLVSRSQGSAVTPADGHSDSPVLSGNGRYVAFGSQAGDLLPGLTAAPGAANVYLFDRIDGTTRLVSRSRSSATTAGNASSLLGGLSDDGRFVAFQSEASDLAPGPDANHLSDVFLFDRVTGTVTLVSRAANAADVPVGGEQPRLSADGGAVAFLSEATVLVPGQSDDPDTPDVFLWNRVRQTAEIASRSATSPFDTGNRGSSNAAISADGLHVAFGSDASDLVGNDFNSQSDTFLYTVQTEPGRSFFTLPPCRLLDTRQPADGPALASGVTETLAVHGRCGVPATATAVTLNVTVVQPAGPGHLTLHAGDLAVPLASTINFGPGQTRANNAILPLALNGNGSLAVTPAVAGNGTVHVILDLTGYFE